MTGPADRRLLTAVERVDLMAWPTCTPRPAGSSTSWSGR